MDRQADLYEDDVYLWTQGQAEALRAAERAGGRSNAIEWARLAEEVEDLGESERHACESLVLRIVEHLLKLALSPAAERRLAWRREVRAFRVALARKLTLSLRRSLEDDLPRLHADAASIVGEELEAEGVAPEAIATVRWTLPQILGEAEDPLKAA